MSFPREAIPSLSVIIPAYNAAAEVARTLDSIQDYLDAGGIDYELLLCDDGSTDRTPEIVATRGRGVKLLRHERNQGKGAIVRRGMLAARCDWALFTDVDDSTRIDHLQRFAPYTQNADVLIASRRLPGSRIVFPQPATRRFSGCLFRSMTRLLHRTGVRDTQCGFKLFRTRVAREVFARQTIDGFCFDVEILVIAGRLGLRVVEVPIDWRNPSATTVSLTRHAHRMFLDLWKIRKNRIAGLYDP